MPTEPHKDILYRELSLVQAREASPQASPLLQEVVNFASNALVRCVSYSEGAENVDLAPLALYRHIMEMADGVEVLIAGACPVPAIPILRSAFEALLSLEYILEDNANYDRRSLSWLAGYLNKRIASYQSLLSNTARGKEFLESIERDKTIRDFPLPPSDSIQAAIANLTVVLDRDQFTEIRREFSAPGRTPHWYSLFGGPADLRELARHLRRHLQYDVLYRQWSMSTHAQDFSPFLTRSADGAKGIRGLREISSLKLMATFGIVFPLDATRLLIDHFHPGETWGDWYLREVSHRFLQIVGGASKGSTVDAA